MKKKFALYIVNGISIVAICSAVIVLLSVVLTKSGEVPNIMGYSVFRVLTGSMEPTIPTDSLIVVERVDAAEVEVDDVISYFSQDPSHGGAVNTHRVVAIEENDGNISFVTKGDANQVEDRYAAYAEDLIGKVVFTSHGLGVAVHLLSNPLIFIPLIVLPMIVILIYNLTQTIRTTRTIMREEEEAAVKEALDAMKRERENQKKEE